MRGLDLTVLDDEAPRLDEEALWDLVDRDAPELAEYLERFPAERARVDELRGLTGAIGAASAPPAERRGERVGRYEIVRWLGEGGMGVVYEARQEAPERLVALKLVRAGLSEDFAREAFARESRALARLSHPAIATIHEAGRSERGELYLAMELVRGAPITRYASDAALGDRARVELFLAVCDAVQDAHEHGVLHRDLKPSNVLVDQEGRPKVLDFGLARVVEAGRTLAATTAGGGLLGTLPYMAPEELTGERRAVGARSDVYSLGVMLYELLTGVLPFDFAGVPLASAVRAATERAPARPSRHRRELSGDLDTIALKALAKDPRERYGSVDELALDLRRWLEHRPVRARRAGPGYRLRKLMRRHWLGFASLGLIVLLFLFGAYASNFRVALFNTVGGTWFMEAAPFEELRWRGDVPVVRVAGEWYELAGMDGLEAGYVVGFCKQAAGPEAWRKRFSEDLVQVLHRLGDMAVFTVDLDLRRLDDQSRVVLRDVPLEHDHRRSIRDDRYRMVVGFARVDDGGVRVRFEEREWELVEVDGLKAAELVLAARRIHGAPRWGGSFFDLYTEARGESPGATLELVLRDPASGELRRLADVPRTDSPPAGRTLLIRDFILRKQAVEGEG